MRPRNGRVAGLTAPTKALAQRFAIVLLVSAAVSLLVFGKMNGAAVARLRAVAVDQLAPLLDVLSRPVEAASDLVEAVHHHFFVYGENERLREENARLLQWQAIAHRLEQENARLRQQLHFHPDPAPAYVSARVIADSGGPFVRTMLLNAGRRDGIIKGQAAVTGTGLAGRVAEVGEHSARLLLLTDLNSRVPVVVESSRYRAVLAGDNSNQPRLIYLPMNATVTPGDRIVTSGHGGMLPPGLPVGVVTKAVEGDIRVQPFADWDRLEHVTVLRYELPRLNDGTAASAETAKP